MTWRPVSLRSRINRVGGRASLLIASLTVSGMALAAPPAEPAADPEIRVEGRQLDPEQAKKSTSTVLRTLAVKGTTGQVARWQEPICPKVVGISDAAAKVISAKIRKVAEDAGARVGAANCTGNVVVAFVDKPAEVYRAYAKRQKLDYVEGGTTLQSRLATSTRAVRWWYDVDTRSSSGKKLNQGTDAMMGNLSGGAATTTGAGGDNDQATRLGDNVRSQLLSATILVDNAQVLNTPLEPLAAHIAMVAVGAFELPEKPLAVASVVNLFDDGPGSDDLSEWDRAYLTALYQTGPNEGFVQRNAIVSRVAKSVEAAGTP
jgi:hypothetical protein